MLPRACVAIAFRVCLHGRAMNYIINHFIIIHRADHPRAFTHSPRRGTTHIVSFTQNGGAGTLDGSGYWSLLQSGDAACGSGAFGYSEGDRYRSQRSVRRLSYQRASRNLINHLISQHISLPLVRFGPTTMSWVRDRARSERPSQAHRRRSLLSSFLSFLLRGISGFTQHSVTPGTAA